MRWYRNLPNLLTCSRIALTPWIVISLMGSDCYRALWLSLIGGATDAADGFLARRFGWVTRAGAYLDPIADKLLLTSLYICFGLSGMAPVWLVWLVVGRDALILLIAALSVSLTDRREYPPTFWGKLSTTVQIVAAVVFLGSCAVPHWIPSIMKYLAIATVAAATSISGLDYGIRALRWRND